MIRLLVTPVVVAFGILVPSKCSEVKQFSERFAISTQAGMLIVGDLFRQLLTCQKEV